MFTYIQLYFVASKKIKHLSNKNENNYYEHHLDATKVFNDTINTKKSNKWRQKTEIMDGTKHECL